MSFGDILTQIAVKVGKVAPLVATALGSPLAGVALSLLGSTFGIDPTKPEEILERINADPEALLKIKQMEFDHEARLKQIAAEEYQAQLVDVQNARAAKVATEQYTGKKDWIVSFLVVMAVLLFAGCLLAAFLTKGSTNHMFLFLIGQQSGVYLSVYAFYFSGIDPKKMFDAAKVGTHNG